ncbi:MAG: tetratricopeptide repeat protein [Planctomycetota bacterium]|nr:tetratricopeptide repeat protein [Planctomycetota bacterium]
MRKFTSRPSIVFAAAVWCGAFLCGCNTEHSDFTQEVITKGNDKHNELKSAAAYDAARQRFGAGDLKAAYQQIETAIALNSREVEALLLRAQILLEMGDDENAMRAAVKAGLKVAPDDARFYYYMGVFYDRNGYGEKAYQCYASAAELDENLVQYKLAAAEMLMEWSKLDEAENYLQTAKKRHPNAAGVRQLLGQLAQLRDDEALATRYFEEAILLAPKEERLRENLALSYYRQKKYDRAVALLEKMELGKNEDAPRRDLQAILAECYLYDNRPVPAKKILRRLLTAPDGEAYDLWVKMAEVSLLLEDLTSLRTAAERLLTLNPQQEDGYLALSRYWDLTGDKEQARATLDRLPAEVPPSPLYRDYRDSLE